MKYFLFLIVDLLIASPSVLAKSTQSIKVNQLESSGINWVEGKTWSEIVALAKKNNKQIFVDCHATWCKPCKIMDQQVFPNDSIVRLLNSRFVSIKLQMDSTKEDNKEIRKWHPTAAKFKKEYQVDAMPTFLFFSSEGEIAHKHIGALDVKGLSTLLNDVQDPQKQYYTLLAKYKKGRVTSSQVRYLAVMADRYEQTDFALVLARKYMEDYLNKASEAELCTRENLAFIANFQKMIKSSDRIFNIYFNKAELIDAIVRPGYSKTMIDIIINREEITPFIENANKSQVDLDWGKIIETIQNKYGKENAYRIVLKAKARWYEGKRTKWPEQSVKYFVEKTEALGIDTSYMGLFSFGNSIERIILRHSTDSVTINKGVEWMELVLRKLPQTGYFYPYAGLLYKSGRRSESLEWQKLVLSIIEYENFKYKRNNETDKEYLEQKLIFEKMSQGESAANIWFDK